MATTGASAAVTAGGGVSEVAAVSDVLSEKPAVEISRDAAPQLAQGLINSIVPPLDILENQLKECRESQQSIITSLEAQSTLLKEDQKFQEVMEAMALLSLFHGKLLTIRKDMMFIADKTTKMKKRLQKLEGKKVKLATKSARELEQARMHEESLRARPAADFSNAEEDVHPPAQMMSL